MYPTLHFHLHQECPCNLCCHQSKEEVWYFSFTEPKRIWQDWVDEHCINHCQHPMCDIGHNKKDNNLKMLRFYLFRNGVVDIIVNTCRYCGFERVQQKTRSSIPFPSRHSLEGTCMWHSEAGILYCTHPTTVHPRCMSPLSEKQKYIGLGMVTS